MKWKRFLATNRNLTGGREKSVRRAFTENKMKYFKTVGGMLTHAFEEAGYKDDFGNPIVATEKPMNEQEWRNYSQSDLEQKLARLTPTGFFCRFCGATEQPESDFDFCCDERMAAKQTEVRIEDERRGTCELCGKASDKGEIHADCHLAENQQ